ncbi:hypothetical protein [Nostoc favosum]|uniref:Uncharacterized protein n=1 Tax=Nostoc favosum CHAB5714 TaxID=2780399 RepID=A0ABS8I462_9NOSO|nr:hypothetical protein [Nostoc favosum]MCC5598970.1 hypothetical protein [Nostoc favosum CHAB5714]
MLLIDTSVWIVVFRDRNGQVLQTEFVMLRVKLGQQSLKPSLTTFPVPTHNMRT